MRRDAATIVANGKNVKHFQMRWTNLVQLVQRSGTLLQGWRGNCEIKFPLHCSDPNCPDVGETEEVRRRGSTCREKRPQVQSGEGNFSESRCK
jgi:hypothetical protein